MRCGFGCSGDKERLIWPFPNYTHLLSSPRVEKNLTAQCFTRKIKKYIKTGFSCWLHTGEIDLRYNSCQETFTNKFLILLRWAELQNINPFTRKKNFKFNFTSRILKLELFVLWTGDGLWCSWLLQKCQLVKLPGRLHQHVLADRLPRHHQENLIILNLFSYASSYTFYPCD